MTRPHLRLASSLALAALVGLVGCDFDGGDQGNDSDTAIGEDTGGDDEAGTSTEGGTGTGGETTSTEPSGPGVFPGEGGLEAFCRRYIECGGTYYETQQNCMDLTYDFWGQCPAMVDALDGFGACMAELECSEYDPDAYNPADTGCGDHWNVVLETSC